MTPRSLTLELAERDLFAVRTALTMLGCSADELAAVETLPTLIKVQQQLQGAAHARV